MLKLGLIGKNVKYSYSKDIFEYLFAYAGIDATYDLISTDTIDIELLKSYDGLNVTIPYKQEVLKMMNRMDKVTINTIKKQADTLELFNTDLDGFVYTLNKLIKDSPISNVIILGTGAMSQMIENYFIDRNATVYVVSRNACETRYISYQDILCYSADLIINTTPCGMFPNLYDTPIDKVIFNNVRYAIDLAYKPFTTQFLWDAKQAGVACHNGLDMLIVQALSAFEIWCDYTFDRIEKESLVSHLKIHLQDKILLIGMSFSGKTTLLNDVLFDSFQKFDLDNEIVSLANKTIPQIFQEDSEAVFRQFEFEAAKDLSARSNVIVASGGGIVLSETVMSLFREFMCVHVDTPLDVLIHRYHDNRDSRPLLSSQQQLEVMFEQRKNLYKMYADIKLSELRK